MLRLISVLLFALMHAGTAATQAPSVPLLVENAWLAQQLGRHDLVVIDARDTEQYRAGHIAGAINIPVDHTFDQTNRAGLVAPISQLQKLFSSAGLTHRQQLVIYDDGRFIDAGRLFWVLEVMGHRDLAVLNAGFPRWQARGLPVSREISQLAPSDYSPTVNPKRLATAFSTLLATQDARKTIIDVRSPEEFLGRQSIASRKGHIPRARNIPWSRLIVDRGGNPRIRAQAELEELFADIDKDSRVITYCNKGKQSALTYFVLRMLGYDVAAYDGSWSEWGNDHSLPIVSPETRPQVRQ